jgi:all-trans-retinol 13,14-reductase
MDEGDKLKLCSEKFDAIVIGSGMGGLCTASILSKAGKNVLVLEQHYTAGGFTHSFKKKGYEWDVGVHYIGKVHEEDALLRKVFDYVSDGQLKWAFMGEVYDRMVFPDEIYDFKAGENNFKNELIKYFPKEEKAINDYVKIVINTAESFRNFVIPKVLPPPLDKLLSPFLGRKFLHLGGQTTLSVLNRFTGNEKLIGTLAAQWGDYGLPPGRSSFGIHALVVDHFLDGGNYPVGGASSIARTLITVIERNGGRVAVKAPVKEILIENGQAVGVLLKNGGRLRSPLVISGTGVINTFSELVRKNPKGNNINDRYQKVRPSLAHVCLYIGIEQSAQSLGLKPANLWIFPGYDHDANLSRYLRDPSAPLPLVFISFPSSKDPDWDKRFPNKATIEVVSLAPYEWFQNWEDTQWGKRGEGYEDLKKNFTDRLLQQLYKYVPQVQDKIDYWELSSPLSTRHFCNYKNGEIYGLEHTPHRFKQNWLRPKTPIKNLFLTGQDIATAGVGGALISGVLTSSAILKRNLLKEILIK